MLASEQEYDDLTKIDGIGPTYARRLRDAGIHTFADLTRQTPARVVEISAVWSEETAESWIKVAAELAATNEKSDFEPSVELPAPIPAISPGEDVETGVANVANFGSVKWQRIALIQVEYQKRWSEDAEAEYRTLINYHDIDKSDKWAHIETEKIGGWIVEQAGDKLQPEVEEVPVVKPKPEQKTTVRLSVVVTDVRLYQPDGKEVSLIPGNNGRPSFGAIQVGLPFTLETDIALNVEGASHGEWEIPCQAQFYARNRKTGEKIHLGDTEPSLLDSGEVVSASLKQIVLPAGRYRLQVLVVTEREDVTPGYFEVQVLEVV